MYICGLEPVVTEVDGGIEESLANQRRDKFSLSTIVEAEARKLIRHLDQ